MHDVLNNLSIGLGLGHGHVRQELLDRNLILFRCLIKTFAVAVARQDEQRFVRIGCVGIEGLSDGRWHPAIILESDEENGAITDAAHRAREVKVGRTKASPPCNPIENLVGDGKARKMKE